MATDHRNSDIEEPVDVPRPRWLDWCEKNSVAKRHEYPRPKRELTQWQKRGPMTRRDWVRFYNWATKNAIPRDMLDQIQTAPATSDKKKTKKKRKPLEQLLERILKLCVPRHKRNKYEYPPTPHYPYSPKIHYRSPPHHDRGRPFDPPLVPQWFQHIELEIEFWNTLRFPLRRSTLKYTPSPNILRLAQPRVLMIEDMHCPVPEKPIEEIAPRQRMSYRQWRIHQRRLEYLAKPVSRPYYQEFIC